MNPRASVWFGASKVTLQHSRAAQAVYRQLLDRQYEPALAARLARKERSHAKLHAKPIRILTPYQLLRAAYQLKGHEASDSRARRSGSHHVRHNAFPIAPNPAIDTAGRKTFGCV